jgi:hypothetical protein
MQFELRIRLNNETPDNLNETVRNPLTEEPVDDKVQSKESLSLSLECKVGSERLLDLMIPDRYVCQISSISTGSSHDCSSPMDIRFSVFNSYEITEEAMPLELQNYNRKLASLYVSVLLIS